MKNRKRGFSLVELLIVLAVIAALIATITPVALNAIQKAKATQVAQNLKTLASAFENKLYVDGSAPTTLADLGRDIDSKRYGFGYTATAGEYKVVVWGLEQIKEETLKSVLNDAAYDASLKPIDFAGIAPLAGFTPTAGLAPSGTGVTNNGVAYYTFTFVVY